MIPVTCCNGKRIAVFGLGGSGLATCEALMAGGADVTAWDDGEASREKARQKGIALADFRETGLSGYASLVLSPGVPLTHPEPHWAARKAQEAGVEIIGDVELLCRQRRAHPPSILIGITGTNGKSTTTALIAHVLRSAGLDVQVGGNIGTAVLSLEPPAPGRIYVVEMSSFQIDLAPALDATIGVLMNITPDHLDRHGTMENYAAIKERLVAGAELAIVGVDDEPSRAIASRRSGTGKRLALFSAERKLDTGFFLKTTGGLRTIQWRAPGVKLTLATLDGVAALRGRHNGQNAAAACAVAAALGLPPDAIAAGVASFPGLAHRMEPLGHAGPVAFVNDSKATNADSTEKALASFSGGVFWILGGKAKEGGIAPLAPLFSRVEKAYLIGDASESFAATLQGRVPFERCGTLDVAVAKAAADAAASRSRERVVLLSPACASYDQYPNFEVRGEHFRALVTALPGFER